MPTRRSDTSCLRPAPRPVRIAKRLTYRLLHAWRRPHRVDANIHGISISFPSRSKLAEGIYANAWERHERVILDNVIRPGSTVIDIGANIGFYTCLFAATVGPAGSVFAFEPTPSTLELLTENLERNALSNVRVSPVALSDRDGEATFNVFPDGSDAYNSLGASAAYGHAAVQRITVKTSRLDEYEIRPEAVSAIKIDVEGAEGLVIDGGRELLRRCERAVLMVELNEDAARQCGCSIRAIITVLDSLGFRGYRLFDDGALVPLDDRYVETLIGMRAVHYDAFFVQRAGEEILRGGGLLA